MAAGVARALVELDRADDAVLKRGEPHTERHGVGIAVLEYAGHCAVVIERARALADDGRRTHGGERPRAAHGQGYAVGVGGRQRHGVFDAAVQRRGRSESGRAARGVVGHGAGRNRAVLVDDLEHDRGGGDGSREQRTDRRARGNTRRAGRRPLARCRQCRCVNARIEGVDVVVGAAEGGGGEGAGAAVDAGDGRAEPTGDVQRAEGRAPVCPEVVDRRVVALRVAVGNRVGLAAGDRDRSREVGRLPSRRGLRGERHRGQTHAGRVPERSGVSAGVGRALVEAHAGDESVGRWTELQPQLHRRCVAGVDRCRHLGAEHGVRSGHGVTDGRGRRSVVRAVVDRADPHRLAAGAMLNVGVRPGRGAGGQVPGDSTVGGDFDPGDHAAHVVGGSRENDARTIGDGGSGCRRRDRHGRGRDIGARRCGDQGRVEGEGLRAHVGQKVDLGLCHPRVCGRAEAIVRLVETPGPLN